MSGDITVVLDRWREGDPEAVRDLAPLVYEHLRRIAVSYLNRENPGHTLQATGLVNEVFVRLLRQARVDLSHRQHFFAFAARMMRRILVDHARANLAAERAPGHHAIPLSPELAWVDAQSPVMVDLDTALNQLEGMQDRKARLVELRIFLGLTAEEAADVLGVSKATADRDFRFAMAWLGNRLRPAGSLS